MIYEIKNLDSCFDEFYSLLIVVASLATAAQVHASGVVDYKQGDTIALECRHLSDKEVHLPLFGLVQSALAGITPHLIEILVKHRSHDTPHYRMNTKGFSRSIEFIFQPFFVNFYEQFSQEIYIKYGAIDKYAPQVWQMGWLVRNAISHNGCVYFREKNHQPVAWKGLVLGPHNNGQKIFHNIFSPGDLIILMLEMEEVRTKLADNKIS
jgi:hypothetical protein